MKFTEEETKLGYEYFSDYYKIMGWKPTLEKFNKNRLRISFIKLARFYENGTLIPRIEYIKYIFENNVALRNWNSNETFNKFVDIYTKNEDKLEAISRTKICLKKYNTNNLDNISVPIIINNIELGNISPYYIFYCYKNIVPELIEQLPHKNLLNPAYWIQKLLQ